MLKFRSVALLAGASLAIAACGSESAPQETEKKLTLEEFKATVVQDPEGKLIVDGDQAFDSMDEVEALYRGTVEGKSEGGLAVYYLSGRDVKYDSTRAVNLTYCVSSASFGSRYSTVVNAMASAAGAWESTGARINFIHASSYDSNCTASQTGVWFDVRQVNSGGQYLARAFFPNSARSSRNVLIDTSAFGSISPWTLTGVLRHELGHVLGFRHEHTRLSSTGCYEDANWRALTSYDSKSVMHYPQCNGTQTGDLVLTSLDVSGIKALYP
jgi:hypothetical protein